MTCNNELSREDFQAYLESLNKSKSFADRREATSCPLAQYFHSKGHEFVSVMYWSYRLDSPDSRFDTPEWVRKFISLVDKTMSTNRIQPRTALKYLKEIES